MTPVLSTFALLLLSAGPDRQTLWTAGEGGYSTYRIPVVCVDPSGTVLAFCEARKNSAADQGDIDLVLRRSEDGGRTWEPSRVIFEEGGDTPITIGNPCPIPDPEAGVTHLLFCQDNLRAFYTRTDDGGRTWAPRREITAAFGQFDYDVVRVATGPVHGLKASSGRLVAPVWMSNRSLEEKEVESTLDRMRSGTLISDDGGRTWRAGGLVPATVNRLNECTVAELTGGRLLLNCRGHSTGFRAHSVSDDGGESWTAPALMTQLPDTTCQGSILRIPEGPLLLSNIPTPLDVGNFSKRRRGLTLKVSTDEGRTWQTHSEIEPGPSAYSDLALVDGKLLCISECGEKVYRERIDVTLLQIPESP